ncbi:MAG TPA: recombination mediator RecR, partial [Patescibacteria group bacterium]|nr:recombination mediator RecR [Patescibacteria group bacterium]
QKNLDEFSTSLKELKKDISVCRSCGAISNQELCSICSNSSRDPAQVCVISTTQDMISVENTNKYQGIYHVLGGNIDTVEGVSPDQLNISPLLEKAKQGKIKEVILALDSTLEGDTTAKYLISQLKPYNIKITRLARGLPMGSDLEYADSLTLINALENRNEIDS